MKKKYVLDASVLIHDVDCFSKIQESECIIPITALVDLNHLKGESSERGEFALKMIDFLDKLSTEGPLKKGIPYKSNTIRVSYLLDNTEALSGFQTDIHNYGVLQCAINEKATLMTCDKSLRIFARDFVEVTDYLFDTISEPLYKGYRIETVPSEVLTMLYQQKSLPNAFNLSPNEFIIFEDEWNPSHRGVGICKHGQIVPCFFDKLSSANMKTKPLNLEQKMLLYLLHMLKTGELKALSIVGGAGRGKTLQAIDFGLSSVLNQEFLQFIYTKSVISIDSKEELGFLPGDEFEKFRPYLAPFYSAIEIMYKEELYKNGECGSVDAIVEKLLNSRKLNFLPLAAIRGMTIHKRFVLFDEAQNVTQHTMKGLTTRLDDDSSMIITGDIGQVDNRYLNAYNNGLVHFIKNGQDKEFIGHITLDIDKQAKRGILATFGSNCL